MDHKLAATYHAQYTECMIAPSVLDVLFQPVTEISAEAAREIIGIRLEPSLQMRLDEYADLANRGELSADQREDYEQFIDGLDVLAVLKSKARAALNKSQAH
jgi:hypothetical protein